MVLAGGVHNAKQEKVFERVVFFSKSRMTLQKWLLMMYLWARNYPLTDAAEEAGIDAGTAVDVFQWFREVCSTKLLQTPLVLGGAGVVVQIDESLFRHKPKAQVSFITAVVWEVTTIIIVAWVYIYIYIYLFYTVQYHRGRRAQQEQWVFGMVDTSHQPALGYMEVVQRRDATTLLPIIQAHTAPGTIIHSDEWAAYRRVNTLPGIVGHNTVNHSLNFVDPVSGTHTQNVESYWSRAKQKIKKMKGCHAEQLPSYLDEFMWRERHGSSARIAFFSLMTDIAQQCPV